jgi:hypothetical protein
MLRQICGLKPVNAGEDTTTFTSLRCWQVGKRSSAPSFFAQFTDP